MYFTIKTLTDAGAALLAHGDAEKKASIIDSIIVSNNEPNNETAYADLTFNDFGQYKEFSIVNMRENKNTFTPEVIVSNDGFTTDYQINMVGLKGHTDGEDNSTLIAVAIDTSNSPLVLPAQTSMPYKLYLDFSVAYSNSSNVQANVSNAGMVDFDTVNSMVSVALSSAKDYVDSQAAIQFDNSVKVADSYTDSKIVNLLKLFSNNVPVPISASGTKYGIGQWNGVSAFYNLSTNVIALHGFANPQAANDYLTLDVSSISNYMNSPIDIVSSCFNSMTQINLQPHHVYDNTITIPFDTTGIASFEGVTIQLGKVSAPAVKPQLPSFAPSDTQIIDYPFDANNILSSTHYFVTSTQNATNTPSDLGTTSPNSFLIYYGLGYTNNYITENIQTVNVDGTIGSKKYHRYTSLSSGWNSYVAKSTWHDDWEDGFDPYYHS